MKRLTLILVMSLIAVVTVAGTARAQSPTPENGRDPKQEQEILNRLRAINPDAVSLFQNGTDALDRGDAKSAKTFFEFVLQLAPKFPEALRRLAYAELSLGNVESAIARAREAVQVDNSSYNRVTLVRALISANDPTLNAEALALAKSAVKDSPDDLSANEALMWAGAASQDMGSIRQGSTALVRLAPDYGWGHYYVGMLAMQEGQQQKGKQELQAAKNLGVPEEMVNEALNPQTPTPAPVAVKAPAQSTPQTEMPNAASNSESGMTPLFLGAIAIAIVVIATVVLYTRRRAS